MWRADGVSWGGRLVLTGVVVAAGCASATVVANRQSGRATSSVLRLATELGINDVSDERARRFEITVQVRSPPEMQVRIPGCAVRAFRARDFGTSDFDLTSIAEDPDIRIDSVTVIDPDVREARRVPVIVPPGGNQMVRFTVIASRAALGRDEIGIRLDSSDRALRATSCADIPIGSEDTEHVEHYVLPGELIEIGGLAAIAGAVLLAIIVLTVR